MAIEESDLERLRQELA
jgi:Ca2+-binding EF-hand superfamily protein